MKKRNDQKILKILKGFENQKKKLFFDRKKSFIPNNNNVNKNLKPIIRQIRPSEKIQKSQSIKKLKTEIPQTNYSHISRMSRNSSACSKKSLNMKSRYDQMMRIQKQNIRMIEKILFVQSSINRNELKKFNQKNNLYKSLHSKYTYDRSRQVTPFKNPSKVLPKLNERKLSSDKNFSKKNKTQINKSKDYQKFIL